MVPVKFDSLDNRWTDLFPLLACCILCDSTIFREDICRNSHLLSGIARISEDEKNHPQFGQLGPFFPDVLRV